MDDDDGSQSVLLDEDADVEVEAEEDYLLHSISVDDELDDISTGGPLSASSGLAGSYADEKSLNTNTVRSMRWGVRAYDEWRRKAEVDPVGGQLVQSLDDTPMNELDNILPRFIDEVRRRDGGPYPSSTLYQLMCSLQRYLRWKRPDEFQKRCFVDIDNYDRDFQQTAKALHAKMITLAAEGIGGPRKLATAISIEDEVKMWQVGVFGAETAKQILGCVFYYIGKLFRLGLTQQHGLTLQQISVGADASGRWDCGTNAGCPIHTFVCSCSWLSLVALSDLQPIFKWVFRQFFPLQKCSMSHK